MRFKLLTLASALILQVGLLAIPAKAFEISNGGLAFGMSGNFSTLKTTGTEKEGNTTNTNAETEDISTSITKEIDFASFFGEYALRDDDLLGGWAGITVGLEWIPYEVELGAKSRSDTDIDSTGSDSSTYTARAELSNHVSLYAEPTFYAGQYFGFYAKGGISRVTVRTLETINSGINSSSYPDVDVWGRMYGAGVRATTPVGLFVKLEYARTDYGSIHLKSTSGNKNTVTANPDQDAVRLQLGWMF